MSDNEEKEISFNQTSDVTSWGSNSSPPIKNVTENFNIVNENNFSILNEKSEKIDKNKK